MKEPRIFGSVHHFLEAGQVLGRIVANEGFFHTLLSLDPFDAYVFFLHDPTGLRDAMQNLDLPAIRRGAVHVLGRQALATYMRTHPLYCVHLADPLTDQTEIAFLRNRFSPVFFPITSVPHTLSYLNYAKEFLYEIWPGTSPRDVICVTSNAAKAALQEYFGQLRGRYHLPDHWREPGLHLLPLGVDSTYFVPPTIEQRHNARQRLQLAQDQCCCLVHGRIAVDDKMDLLPLLYAVQRIQRSDPQLPLHLMISGHMREHDNYPQVVTRTAEALHLPLTLVADPTKDTVRDLYHAADLFLSPSDNLQETFGLTLLEAASSGLPCIVSDWDGYRDLVIHEETGLLIPTIGPAMTPWLNDLSYSLPDNIHQLLRAQQTAVDVPSLAHAIHRLAKNNGLRTAMGERARQHVAAAYDWRHIVQRWLALIEELWQRPISAEEEQTLRAAEHPCHLDICRLFQGHPSSTLSAKCWDRMRLQTTVRGLNVLRGRELAIVWPEVDLCLHQIDIRQLLTLARHPIALQELTKRVQRAALPPETVQFAVLWALKHDLLQNALPDEEITKIHDLPKKSLA